MKRLREQFRADEDALESAVAMVTNDLNAVISDDDVQGTYESLESLTKSLSTLDDNVTQFMENAERALEEAEAKADART
jgi:hypothetical protein